MMDQTEVDGNGAVVLCENIHKTYLLGTEGFPALRGVAMSVKKGEFLLIYGTSGGGKSTLLNILGTIDVPTKGNFYLFGERVTGEMTDAQLARIRCERIGFVFQSFNLLPSMNAIENVSLPMVIAGKRSASEIKERAKSLLQLVGLGDRLHHLPPMMSGGEQQRVTMARALANEPEILLLDEPTGDLDTENTLMVLNILTKLNREHGLTMVMVTHDVYMKQYAHRVLYVRDGKVQSHENIDPCVRENALRKLQEDYENALKGSKNEETLRLSSVTRPPTEYATVEAQADISFDEDLEMWKVVEVLFAS